MGQPRVGQECLAAAAALVRPRRLRAAAARTGRQRAVRVGQEALRAVRVVQEALLRRRASLPAAAPTGTTCAQSLG